MSVPLNRRRFLTASSATVALTGIEGILAARRAPAVAQGTKLHIVRWVDFIPEADVELKRQAPEAGKALGPDHPQAIEARLLMTDVHRFRGRTKEMQQELSALVPLVRDVRTEKRVVDYDA
jgi:hypothetical protein